MRADYIEPDYVNGVYDQSGKRVIRPLNAKEKEFLNSFYEEVINANFMHDDILRQLHKEIKELKNKDSLSNEEKNELERLRNEYYTRADEVLLYSDNDDQKKLYGENNARNRCLYNRSKSVGMLDELNDETYDAYHKTAYNNPCSGEQIMINQVDKKIKTILKKRKRKKKS